MIIEEMPPNNRAGIQRFAAVGVYFQESCRAPPVGGLFRPLCPFPQPTGWRAVLTSVRICVILYAQEEV